MLGLVLILIAQDGLGIQTVEAAEVLQRKPHFAYQLPEWVTDEYLFSLSGFSLDDEIEKCIDATILTVELGGKPLIPALVGPYEHLGRLRPDSALGVLEIQLEASPSPDVRRQILLYRITADWMRGDIKRARQSLETLKSDKEAAVGANLDFVSAIISYWEDTEIRTSDSLLYYLLVMRKPDKALKFLPDNPNVAKALKYHLDDNVEQLPDGAAGRFLAAHRIMRQGKYKEAADFFKQLEEIRSPYMALSRYSQAFALMGQGQSRMARLVVPDTFPYQWLLPKRSLALLHGRVEWAEGWPDKARKWFKDAQDNPAFDLYSQWVMDSKNPSASTEAYFDKRNAGELYRLLRVTTLVRNKDYPNAIVILEDLLRNLDMFTPSPVGDFIVALYAALENEMKNYMLTIGLADAIKKRSANLEGKSYFATAANLAVADAYYYAGGRYEDFALAFYEYCTKSTFDDLRHLGYFGLAWSFLSKREPDKIKPIISSLSSESLTEWESQVFIFLDGLVLYAERNFRGAAEVFARLNLSSVPEMRMQGLYFEARSYEQSERSDLAASAYSDLLAEFPDAEEVRDAWPRLVRAQVQMGDLEQAEKTLNRLIEQAKLRHFQFIDLYKEILLLIFDAAMAKGNEDQAQEIAQRFSLAQNSTLALEAFYYRIGERDTALWQTDHLISTIAKLSQVNPQSAFLPPLLLQVARMEIQLGEYESAIKRLESIIQWRKLSDVSNVLPEAQFELIRTYVFAKDWDNVVLQSKIFMNNYPDLDKLAPSILFFHAAALVERAGKGEPLARKEDGKEAISVLDRLEKGYPQTSFVKESSEDIKAMRNAALLLIR